MHIEIVKRNNGADGYCMKEETRIDGPWEYGKKPVRVNSKVDWSEVRQNAISGQLDKIPDNIFITHYGNLRKIEKDYMSVEDAPDVRGVWIHGPAGIGKSRKARHDYPDFYPKLCNKWWDGYQGQPNIIMDDLDPKRAEMLAQ